MPVRCEMRGRVCWLAKDGGISGRLVMGEGKAGGMASKSILVKAEENWLEGSPMAMRARVIQIIAVGGASAFPRCR